MTDVTGTEAALSRLKSRWSSYWPGADVPELAADVGARLRDAASAWGLDEIRALDGGEVGLVCAAVRDGRPVVLKLLPRGHAEDALLTAEVDALAFWRQTGAVPEVLGRRDRGFTFLLERLLPGGTLDASGVSWDERLEVLGQLAAQLHAAGAPPDGFVHVAAYARSWRRALAPEHELLAELEALLVPGDDDVLLHADLHGGNVLRDRDEWKVIDPHAARGNRHADVWALLDPLVPALPGDASAAARAAERWLARYTDAAGMDNERARGWTRVRARAEACAIQAGGRPTTDEQAWAGRLHRMADALTRSSGARPR